MADMKTLSFAKEVKEEIAREEWPEEEVRSLLSAFCKINGSFSRRDGRESLDISSESAQIAKSLYGWIKHLYGVDVRFAYSRQVGFKKKVRFHVLVDEPDYVLGDLEVDFLTPKIPKTVVATSEQSAAYLAGAFLAGGSVTDPSSTNYHLEVAFSSESDARWFCHLVNKVQNHQFTAKFTKRRTQWIVYLKSSDQISNFLILVGATQSCLKFENVRVDRDFSNSVNRLQNLDNANMGKTLAASKRQKIEIQKIIDKFGWDSVPNLKMRILMELRLENDDASLDELAGMMSERLNSTVTKSNVNHIFRKIHAEYGENGDE